MVALITFYRDDDRHIYYDGERFREWAYGQEHHCTWQAAVKICQQNEMRVTTDGAELVERLGEAYSDDQISDFADAGTVERALATPKSAWPNWLRQRMAEIENEYKQIQHAVNAYTTELKARLKCC